MHRQCLSHLHSCDHGERPTGSGGRPTDICEKTENSSERQQAIVLELALCMSKLQVLKKENKARQIGGITLPEWTDHIAKNPESSIRRTKLNWAKEVREVKRSCSSYGRIFKHQTSPTAAMQRTQRAISEYMSYACQSVEDLSQEAHHSALALWQLMLLKQGM